MSIDHPRDRGTIGDATRRFCLLTVGRAGSTALMNVLQSFSDIAVPNKNIECVDNELIHPAYIRGYMAQYAKLTGSPVAGPSDLIDAFFGLNRQATYAGFKTMPNRHRDYDSFVARQDIRFITLTRRDIPSTVASFLTATRTNSWRRFGGAQPVVWRFVPARDGISARGNLAYIRASNSRLDAVPNAIRLAYEDLCEPGYSCPDLDSYFGRPIKLENPKPATSGATYVENWEELCTFLDEAPR
jgi:hypothetical protein